MSGFQNYERHGECSCNRDGLTVMKVVKIVGIAAGVLVAVGLIHKMLRNSKN